MCDAVLQWGIFGSNVLENEYSFVQHLDMWLTHSRYATEEATRKAAIRAGIVIPEIDLPVDLNGQYDNSYSKNFGEALAFHYRNNAHQRARFYQANQSADRGILSAWRECKRLSAKIGLAIVPTYTDVKDGAEILLEVKYGIAGVGADFKARIAEFLLPEAFEFRDGPPPIGDVVDVSSARQYVIKTKDGAPASRVGGFIKVRVEALNGSPIGTDGVDASVNLVKRIDEEPDTYQGNTQVTQMLVSGVYSCGPVDIGPYPDNRKVTLELRATAYTGSGSHRGHIEAFLLDEAGNKLRQTRGDGTANIAVMPITLTLMMPAGRVKRVQAYATNTEATARSVEIWLGD